MSGILTGPEILAQLRVGRIDIDPFNPKHVNPASVDLTLGDQVTLYEGAFKNKSNPNSVDDGRDYGISEHATKRSPDLIWDTRAPWPTVTRTIDPEVGWILKPGICYLMHTVERVRTDHFIPILDGKALALDTEIPTPSGWSTMGDLKEGDLVYGVSGEPVRVIRTTPAFLQRDCFAVEFRNGEKIIADASHEWWVDPVDAKPGIRTTEQLALRPDPRRAIFRVPSSHISGETTNLPIPPYALGVWLGDGTSSTATITIRHGDEQILQKLASEGLETELRCSDERGSSRYIVGRQPEARGPDGRFTQNESFHSQLKAAGLFDDKHIPRIYFRASLEQRWELLRGLMDTDGTVHRDDQASLTFTSERLIRDAEELLRSLGCITYYDERPAKVSGVPTGGTAYRLTWRALPELFTLDRQKSKVRATEAWLKAARHSKHSIMRVTPVASVPVRCITVDAPDGLFLASRSLIPTHNSSIGRAFILIHFTAGYGDPGFDGQYTLEVTSQIPVRVFPGMRFCQIRFHTAEGDIQLYRGNYRGEKARGAVSSALHRSGYDTRKDPFDPEPPIDAETLDALDV